MGIALGEGACRPAGTALIAEMFESRWGCLLYFRRALSMGADYKSVSFLRHRGVANGIFSWGVSDNSEDSSKKKRLLLDWFTSVCLHTNVSGISYFQVYFGYGFSFIFGIYVTQLDLFGQVPILWLYYSFMLFALSPCSLLIVRESYQNIVCDQWTLEWTETSKALILALMSVV